MDEIPPIDPEELENAEELDRALREAEPPWKRDGGGIRGLNPRRTGTPPPTEVTGGRYPIEIKQSTETPPFPATDPVQQTTEESEEATAATNEYSFELELESIDNESGSVEIHVGYGEINDAPPDGMTGADDYFLTISGDGTEIYAVVTYDTDTLDITSRSLAFGSSVPDSIFGTLYVPIGFVDLTVVDANGRARLPQF